MRLKLTTSIIFGIMGLFVLAFSGCYTQLGSTKDEQINGREEYGSSNSTENAEDTSYVNQQSDYYDNYNTYGSNPRYRVGFSYYYPSSYWPSYAFSAAYADPWFYDNYWAYDPWWCGTPYVTYPMNGYSPYGYGYYGSNYYLPSAYYHYGSGYAVVPVKRATRDIGSTRGSGGRGATTNTDIANPGGDRGSSYLPTGGSLNRSGGGISPGANNSKSSTRPIRPEGNQRGSAPHTDTRAGNRTDRGIRGSSSRAGRSRSDGRAEAQPQHRPNNGSSTSPSYTP